MSKEELEAILEKACEECGEDCSKCTKKRECDEYTKF